MNRIFLLIGSVFLALLLGACALPATVVTGPLTGEILWRGKIQVSGDLVVEKGAQLVIAPGTEVLFTDPPEGVETFIVHPNFPGSEIIVRGSIRAEGTPEEPIVFRHADPGAGAGSWGAINLEESPRASFRYCLFRQADSALHGWSSSITVEESVFEDNLVAIRFNESEILVENNLLRRNGTGIRFHFGSPVICSNDILDNDKGFFITSFPRDYRIEANNIVGSRTFAVVLGEEVPDEVLMKGNYWGSEDPETIEESFFDGRRDSYLGKVLYRPLVEKPISSAGVSWKP